MYGVTCGLERRHTSLRLRVHKADGSSFDVPVIVRIDTPVEIDYYRAGGILPYVLAQILRANA